MSVGPVEHLIDVRISHIDEPVRDVKIYQLSPVAADGLPLSAPGSHIDLHLANGMVRTYSLLVGTDVLPVYSVAVKHEPSGRGGSAYIHAELRMNDRVKISPPRNNFPLIKDAKHTVFIAGGIGITPIWGMLNYLQSRGCSWQLHYANRSRAHALFGHRLSSFQQVAMHFDEEADGKFLDVQKVVADSPAHSHFYCCGPSEMLDAFKKAAAGRAKENVHYEYFTAPEGGSEGRRFVVKLARSGKEIVVGEDETILKALRDVGVNVAYSCEEGLCGACETRILSGIPDHRDLVLSAAERAENKTIMICCSRSLGDELVLDL